MDEDRKIISVSRRTDIPAFYTDWFLGRLEAGFAEYEHPFAQKRFSVSLRPEHVSAFVFWSKNFAPLLPHLPEIASQYHFYCHFTITGLPSYLEPNVPPAEEAIRQAKAIASAFTPDHIQWRFDPIFLTANNPGPGLKAQGLGNPPLQPSVSSPKPEALITPQETLGRFSRLAQALEGFTHRCYTSFVDPYPKVLDRLRQANIPLVEPSLEEKKEIVAQIARIASQHGIQIYTCCEDDLVTQAPVPPQGPRLKAQGLGNAPLNPLPQGHGPETEEQRLNTEAPRHPPLKPLALSPKPSVAKARCVDPEILSLIGAPLPSDLRPAPTRQQCGCFKSYDIGAYNTCPHLCLYCYANSNPEKIRQNHTRHNPSHPSLLP